MASSEWDLLEKAWKNTQDDDVQTLPGKYKWLGMHLKCLPLMYLWLAQVASMANLECNRTVKTMMVWFAYEVGSLFSTRISIISFFAFDRLSWPKVAMEW